MLNLINAVSISLSKKNLLTGVYGVARSLLAIGTLITLFFNAPETVFRNIPNHYDILSVSDLGKVSIFYLFPSHHDLIRWLSIFILILVISGWRPRYTGLLHWYITYSFFTSCDFFDGGDQISSILTFFLIPFCLLDNRKWVWDENDQPSNAINPYRNILLNIVYFIIRLQVCIIYFHACVAKMKVPEWIDGTATYYWFTSNSFGAASWLKPIIIYLFSKPGIVVAFTWGTLILEAVLAMSIFMTRNKTNWKILLMVGIVFHFGIIIIHGLISFFMAMTAALILYLFPLNMKIIKRLNQ